MSKTRKLASIQRVYEITPIEGADRIELARVLGWQCVVNKGQFSPGDLGVYFEIDSFLPVKPQFEFLRKSCFRDTDIMGPGFRLKTQRFHGQVSQGLLLPLSVFPEITTGITTGVASEFSSEMPSDAPSDSLLGTDVTELLGVRKWEIEERATTGGTVIGTLPADVPHTDETRIQAMPELLSAFRGKSYYISTKMDGSSHSICIDRTSIDHTDNVTDVDHTDIVTGDVTSNAACDHTDFHVTGHNYEYKDDDSSAFYRFVKSREYRSAMERYMTEHGIRILTIQGEFCAPGIQQNRLKLTKPEWYVFTVRIDGHRVGLTKMCEVAKAINVPTVPIEEFGEDLTALYPTVEALLKRAEGQYPNGGPKEGIVIRTIEPEFCPLISGPLSFKVVSNKYLLKNG